MDKQQNIIFKKRAKDFLIVTLLGIGAGFLVTLFLWVPDNTLWDFSYFSSDTYGFWMLTSASIVLFSQKRVVAAVNTGIFVFFLFLITTITQSLKVLTTSSNLPFDNFGEMALDSWAGWALFSVVPAAICVLLASVFWDARKNTIWGKILLFAPLIFIVIETIWMFVNVFLKETRLFSALTDLACVIIYCFVIRRFYFPACQKNQILTDKEGEKDVSTVNR